MIFKLSELKPAETQYYLQHVVAPRPVCFASTVDAAGNVNLSPFSYFNLFSSNPPIVIFSPARRLRDNTTKHTLQNIQEVPEVVINIVTYELVQQMSLTSCEYEKGVDEFVKGGFTKEPAVLVKPPMAAESKIKLECEVLEVKSLGEAGGAGQLVICNVLYLHLADELLNAEKKLEQQKLDLVARLGGDWYCRTTPESLFKVEKPNTRLGIGMDALPRSIRNSAVLTGNQLGQLANVHELPVVDPTFEDDHLKNIIHYFSLNPADMETELHRHAAQLLTSGNVTAAWQVLLASETIV